MRHIIWRNRASAILGLFVVIVPFTGLPQELQDSLVVLLGALIVIFGFYRGSGNYALVEDEIKTETTEVVSLPEKKEVEVATETKVKRRRYWGRAAKPTADSVESQNTETLSQ